jgi:galactokinase
MRQPAADPPVTIESSSGVSSAQPGSARVVVQAPGRVNLIGEHTDYNGGLVLPVAIDRRIRIELEPTDDRRVELTLEATGETGTVDLVELDGAAGPTHLRSGDWVDYLAGTAWAMRRAGLSTGGFRGRLSSDLPMGAGLSSSAALEIAVAWALSGGERPAAQPLELARIARTVENEYVGVGTGLMDPAVVILGAADHALLLDCRSLEHRLVRLPTGIGIVVIDSGAPRALAASEYNARRAECDAAVATLSAADPSVRTLRDVTLDRLELARASLGDRPFRRARHVVTENARVEAVVAALEAGELDDVGDAMRASHASLRDDFEVSSTALDVLVEIAGGVPGVIGARLTGAGFGGCVVALVEAGAEPAVRAAVERDYPSRSGLTPVVMDVRASDGAGRVA